VEALTFADAALEYSQLRDSDELWKGCLGKQVLGVIATSVGVTNAVTLERAVTRLWSGGEVAISPEGLALREYVTAL
jgi:hypothetical protein